MLGMSPIGSRAISAGPFSLIAIAAAITATGALTFSGSARWGAFLSAHATGQIIFGGSAEWTTLNALSAAGNITFGGNALLKVAGRPVIFYAIPDRHTFNGVAERYSFTAKADNFTFRGMR